MKATQETIVTNIGESFKAMIYEYGYLCKVNFWHFHPEYEIVYIHNGSGNRHVGNHVSNYKDGELLLLGPGLPHLPLGNQMNSDNFEVVIQFSEGFAHQLMVLPEYKRLEKLLKLSNYGISFGSSTKEIIGRYIKEIGIKSSPKKLIALLKILDDLMNTNDFQLLNTLALSTSSQVEGQNRIAKIYAFVSENFNQEIALDTLAGLVGMTKNSLCRFFKKNTGNTVIGFITEFRVTMAKEFLKSSETVAEAMYKAGFNDPSYFNRTFKKTCGLSPTAFKNQIIGDQLPSKNLSYSS